MTSWQRHFVEQLSIKKAESYYYSYNTTTTPYLYNTVTTDYAHTFYPFDC